MFALISAKQPHPACAHINTAPLVTKLTRAASEPEVYRYVMQSLHLFEHAVASEVVQRAADRGRLGGAEPAGEVADCPPDPQDLADAMVATWGKVDFGPLEDIVDR